MMIEIGQLITGNDHSSLAQIKVRLKMQRRFEVYLWNVVFFYVIDLRINIIIIQCGCDRFR